MGIPILLTKRKGSTPTSSTALRTGHARQAIGPLSYVSLMVILSGLILVVMHHSGIYKLDSVFSTNPCLVSQSRASAVLTQRYQSGNPHLENGFGPSECVKMGY